MVTNRENDILECIIKHCNRIEEKTSGLTREKFDDDEDVREIICFNIFQIGEVAKNLSSDFVQQYGNVPWKSIKGMRDIIGHGYGTIDFETVWDSAINGIPFLKTYCEKIIK